MTVEKASAESVVEQRDAFVGRLFEAGIGTLEMFTVYLGDRLGLYRGLAEEAWSTERELAQRAGVAERYTREWLEQQATAGIIEVEDVAAEPTQRRYRLPEAHREVLLDETSLNYLTPLARLTGGLTSVLPLLQTAYREGTGVPWSAYGEDGREGQAAMNRPVYLSLLGKEWLPSIPEIHARLQADPPARVADIGCGGGWASIGIANAYPNVRVDGYDVDGASIELARANAAAAGLSDRVVFHVQDAGAPDLAGTYDLVIACEMIHDLSQPIQVLKNMHQLVAKNGSVLVLDERVAESFTAPGDELERFMYAASVLCCLPVGLSESPSAGTGTVMRADTLRRYAREAGFLDVDVLPIEHMFFRVYQLRS